MDNLTERLLGENFEEALKELEALSVTCNGETKRAHLTLATSARIIRELHARLRTAKAEGAAAREDAARRQSDPFDKAKKIRVGELDGELPQYEEMTGWFQRAPITWLPGLLATVAQHCALRHVFKEGRLLPFVEKAVERAAPGGELRDDAARAGGGR